jgi:hypothetical protein
MVVALAWIRHGDISSKKHKCKLLICYSQIPILAYRSKIFIIRKSYNLACNKQIPQNFFIHKVHVAIITIMIICAL